MSDAVFFPSAADWRAWLETNHESAPECVVGFVKVTTDTANMVVVAQLIADSKAGRRLRHLGR